MALSYFCPHCGGKNLYENIKPKFCAKCGAGFTSTTYASTTPEVPKVDNTPKTNPFSVQRDPKQVRRAPIAARHNEVYDEDDAQDIDYGALSGLEVVIHKDEQNSGVSLRDLAAGEAPATPRQKKSKPRGRKKIMKALPSSFVQEASMSGRGVETEAPDFGDEE